MNSSQKKPYDQKVIIVESKGEYLFVTVRLKV